MAAYGKHINTAEIAYAAINEAEKVLFLKDLRAVGNKDVRQAELALLSGNIQEAETILLQAGQVFRAIMLNIELFRFDRYYKLSDVEEHFMSSAFYPPRSLSLTN